MTLALRSLAVAIVIACALDPALMVNRARQPAMAVLAGHGQAGDPAVIDVRERLAEALAAPAAPTGDPGAMVLINPSRRDLEDLAEGVPVSIVETGEGGPRVEIIRVEPPRPVLPGQAALVRVQLEAFGGAGAQVLVTLEHGGAVVAQGGQALDRDGAPIYVELAYAPPAAGVHRLRVRAGIDGAGPPAFADVALVAQARPLQVLVFEPRPSWALTFLRHALEGDPAFEVAVLARPSRGIDVRAGTAPARLTTASLERFDAIVVGAPDALSGGDFDALDAFARVRGGAVLLQPDRTPSGAFARRLPAARFDELLLETPARLAAGAVELRASELALPRALPPDAMALVSLDQAGGPRPAVFAWPVGHGRFVFSGALDGWRYRSDPEGTFARFWTGIVANLAASAPRALEVTVEPAVSAPGDPLRVRARLRATEFGDRQNERVEWPAVAASVVSEDGARAFVRLWPTTEAGTFEGALAAPAAGRHLVEVSAGRRLASAPMVVAADVRHARGLDGGTRARVAETTGGRLVRAEDLESLAAQLRQMRSDVPQELHPMRSGWWLLALGALLCGEWTQRRRRGLR